MEGTVSHRKMRVNAREQSARSAEHMTVPASDKVSPSLTLESSALNCAIAVSSSMSFASIWSKLGVKFAFDQRRVMSSLVRG